MEKYHTSAGDELFLDIAYTFSKVKNDFIKYITHNKIAQDNIINNRVDMCAYYFADSLRLNIKKYFTPEDQKTLEDAALYSFNGGYDWFDENGKELSDDEYTDEYNKLDGYHEVIIYCILSNLAYLKDDLNNIIKDKSKFIMFDVYGNSTITNYGRKVVDSLYAFIKQLIKNIKVPIREATNFQMHPLQLYFNPLFDKINQQCHIQLTQPEEEIITRYIVSRYKDLTQRLEHIDLQDDVKDKTKELDKLHNYLMANLRKLIVHLPNIFKDENGVYRFSWLDVNGQRMEDFEYGDFEFDVYLQIMDHCADIIAKDLQISSNDLLELARLYRRYPKSEELLMKIRDMLIAKNMSIKNQRKNTLLNNNDDNLIGVKNAITIDYDITNDAVRSKPFVIIKDTNKQDHIFFGPSGTSHGNYIVSKLQADINAKNIEMDPYYMGYGYLLGNEIAFLDEIGDNFLAGYTLNDEINICKNDPRIKKVYTTPAQRGKGGPITRLAKLIFHK